MPSLLQYEDVDATSYSLLQEMSRAEAPGPKRKNKEDYYIQKCLDAVFLVLSGPGAENRDTLESLKERLEKRFSEQQRTSAWKEAMSQVTIRQQINENVESLWSKMRGKIMGIIRYAFHREEKEVDGSQQRTLFESSVWKKVAALIQSTMKPGERPDPEKHVPVDLRCATIPANGPQKAPQGSTETAA